jgi:hypothetical protein
MALGECDCGLRVDQIQGRLGILQGLYRNEVGAPFTEERTGIINQQGIFMGTLVLKFGEGQFISGEGLAIDG